VVLNPPGQYVDDRNLRVRQRFWEHESPIFDIVGWVFNLAGPGPGGVCIAVTNGARELLALRSLTERAVRQVMPDWRMRRATHAFTAENGAEQLGVAFRSVTSMHPARQPRQTKLTGGGNPGAPPVVLGGRHGQAGEIGRWSWAASRMAGP
jgi:hypothetical protein